MTDDRKANHRGFQDHKKKKPQQQQQQKQRVTITQWCRSAYSAERNVPGRVRLGDIGRDNDDHEQ